MADRILETTDETEDNAPANESKADAFRRLANKRMNVALDKIRLVGNLSSRGNYEYTDEQVERIRAALITMVDHTMNKFAPAKERNKQCFEL